MSGATWIGADLPAIWRDGVEYFLLGRDEALYLVVNACPHRGAPLKHGFVNASDEIVCPLHQGAWSVERLITQSTTIRLVERQDARR